jgi:2,4-dienoyl-CoA reductase-like NADH-dependent reductase (Old Yellow Enzyme family)
MTCALFSSVKLRDLSLNNRIVISPMCQHSADDGCANDWHLLHLGTLAVSNAGLVMIESTAVERNGRISKGCIGLWSDENEAALGRVIQACKANGNTRIGIQLSHSGRKGSSQRPWEGGRALTPEGGAWTAVAPSAVPFEDGAPPPRALDRSDMQRIVDSFVDAVRRADRIGIDLAELHAAHGYLMHNFLSPLSNRRTDDFGGSLENRMRYPLEVFSALRAAWPDHKPLGARITGTDWLDGGLTIEDAIKFAQELKTRGCDYVCVTSGGIVQKAPIPFAPGYMVPLAERVKKEVKIPTRAVGYITDPLLANAVVENGQADFIAIGRGFLDDPRWVWHAAQALGETIGYPPQYEKTRPAVWRRTDLPAATALRRTGT